jgi:hypothetical protein
VRRRVTIVAVVCAGAVAACAEPIEITHVLTGPTLAAKPDETPMPVYFNQSPGRSYREVAQIRVRATGRSANADEVIAAAAQDARQVGADAIIVDARRHYGSVQVRIGCDGRPRVDPDLTLNARVTAIQFVPAGAAQPESPPTGPLPATEECNGGR